MKYNFKIKGLDCANCAEDLERKIRRVNGIDKVTINFISEKLIIECNENKKDDVIKEVQKIIKRDDCSIKEI